MKFGVFDHLDRNGDLLADQYADRLRLIGGYDDAGFHMYHLAEHHATPLGMSPSPGVFLSAVAQRTSRLRFGPLVYPLALYHPLRLAEEICMLDHLSNGRFEFGTGRGASFHELEIYGVDEPGRGQDAYAEALNVLLQVLTADRLDFHGSFHDFTDVPIELHPLQRPHPPMWYGAGRPEGAATAALKRFNIVTNLPVARARAVIDAYRSVRDCTGTPSPLMGLNRFIVVAATDEAAAALAGVAYRQWNRSFWELWEARGGRPNLAYYPDTFAEAEQQGFGIAGSPAKVLDTLSAHLVQANANYLVCRFAFGTISYADARRSLDLFTERVMPCLAPL